MNLKKINTIIGREYATRVKKKSFILMTILTPIFFAAIMILPSVIMMMDRGGDQQEILVVDDSGIIAATLQDNSKVKYTISQENNIDKLKSEFSDLGVYALAHISPLDSLNNVSVMTYSTKQLNMDAKEALSSSVNNALREYKLTTYEIEDLDRILKDVRSSAKINTYTITESGETKESTTEVYYIISLVLAMMIYMFVFMFGNMVMRGVIEEKATRIVEVIISSVKPIELMMGKIIGVALVALTQFAIWVALTLALVVGFGSMLAPGGDMSVEQQQEIIANVTSTHGVEAVAEQASGSGLGAIFDTLSQVNFIYLIGVFLIYFILGYLLYASMFAAIGSAVDNEADTQQLVLPITLPLIVGIFIMLSTMQNPDTPLSFWASIVPFVSPMVMMARLPFGVPTWELALSIGLLLGTFILMAYISAKIYRVGILSYGKKANWKDLWKWIKFKN